MSRNDVVLRRVFGAMAAMAVVLVGLGATPGCDDKSAPLRTEFPNEPGGNPLVPEVALLPFPSDFYLIPDSNTNTGWRVSIPQDALPLTVPAHIFDSADGFTMAPAILAWLPGGFDLTTLPDPLDIGATLEDDSAAFLVNGDTGERVAALVELDQNTDEPESQVIILRAQQKLDPATPYVVILRDALRRANGDPHEANDAFRMLRDDVPTANEDIERQRESFVLVNAIIADQGLDPAEVLLAWSFHTRSEEQVVMPLVEMQRLAWEAPVGNYEFTEDYVDGNGENRIREGTFEAPEFRDEDGFVHLDAFGVPIQQGVVDEPFRLTIPLAVDETRPVILYGHGFLGHFDQSSRGAVNQLCRERRFSAVAADLGFNASDEASILAILSGNLRDIEWMVSLNWQKIANFTALVKLTQERLATEITEDHGNGVFNPLDADNIHYSGISNGGTFGYIIASTSPALTRACMIVGGGGLSHFLQRAVNWLEFEPTFELIYPDPIDIQILLSTLQIPIDSIDSINYVHRLTNNRFAGLQPLQAALHMAVNDSQVRNILTEWVARTSSTNLMTPSAKDIWGLETITAPPPNGATGVNSALWVYDEHVTPSPITNEPPLEDNDTHGTSTRLSVFQEHWAQFIEFGRYVQVCDGPCDPE